MSLSKGMVEATTLDAAKDTLQAATIKVLQSHPETDTDTDTKDRDTDRDTDRDRDRDKEIKQMSEKLRVILKKVASIERIKDDSILTKLNSVISKHYQKLSRVISIFEYLETVIASFESKFIQIRVFALNLLSTLVSKNKNLFSNLISGATFSTATAVTPSTANAVTPSTATAATGIINETQENPHTRVALIDPLKITLSKQMRRLTNQPLEPRILVAFLNLLSTILTYTNHTNHKSNTNPKSNPSDSDNDRNEITTLTLNLIKQSLNVNCILVINELISLVKTVSQLPPCCDFFAWTVDLLQAGFPSALRVVEFGSTMGNENSVRVVAGLCALGPPELSQVPGLSQVPELSQVPGLSLGPGLKKGLNKGLNNKKVTVWFSIARKTIDVFVDPTAHMLHNAFGRITDILVGGLLTCDEGEYTLTKRWFLDSLVVFETMGIRDALVLLEALKPFMCIVYRDLIKDENNEELVTGLMRFVSRLLKIQSKDIQDSELSKSLFQDWSKVYFEDWSKNLFQDWAVQFQRLCKTNNRFSRTVGIKSAGLLAFTAKLIRRPLPFLLGGGGKESIRRKVGTLILQCMDSSGVLGMQTEEPRLNLMLCMALEDLIGGCLVDACHVGGIVALGIQAAIQQGNQHFNNQSRLIGIFIRIMGMGLDLELDVKVVKDVLEMWVQSENETRVRTALTHLVTIPALFLDPLVGGIFTKSLFDKVVCVLEKPGVCGETRVMAVKALDWIIEASRDGELLEDRERVLGRVLNSLVRLGGMVDTCPELSVEIVESLCGVLGVGWVVPAAVVEAMAGSEYALHRVAVLKVIMWYCVVHVNVVGQKRNGQTRMSGQLREVLWRVKDVLRAYARDISFNVRKRFSELVRLVREHGGCGEKMENDMDGDVEFVRRVVGDKVMVEDERSKDEQDLFGTEWEEWISKGKQDGEANEMENEMETLILCCYDC